MNTATARRYAKALFDLARQEQQLDPVRERLEQIARMIQTQAELLDLCRNPIYPPDEKRQVLTALMAEIGSPPLLNRFMDLVIRKNRLRLLTEITKVFCGLVDEAQGRQHVHVRVAKGLSSKQEADLRQRLVEMTGRTVELKVESDASLIGGVVIATGGRVYDGSVKGQLQELRRVLVK